MERQRLKEWEESRKEELKQHRMREDEKVLTLKARQEHLTKDLDDYRYIHTFLKFPCIKEKLVKSISRKNVLWNRFHEFFFVLDFNGFISPLCFSHLIFHLYRDKVKELTDKISDTRSGVTEVKTFIDGMRSSRDTKMSDMSSIKAQLKDQNERLLKVTQEKAKMEAKNKARQKQVEDGHESELTDFDIKKMEKQKHVEELR